MKARRTKRGSGILLHPTSLPGPFGIGDIGPAAYHWVDQLTRARQTFWQILPLGPTGFGDSPYQCFSAFAGNPLLISPEFLVRDGLLRSHDLVQARFPQDRVDFGAVIPFKNALLRRAWDNFRAGHALSLEEPFEQFCIERRAWLDDYALFMALKDARRGESWLNWPVELLQRERTHRFREFTRHELAEEIGFYQFSQFLFFRQWAALKQYANSVGIQLIGDVPIFVALDSADVWANPRLFLLDASMRPRAVAGVPPDYFSPTGQLWGNPLYDWRAMQETGYAWWLERIRVTLELVDVIRLDHFRGFCAAWHVPNGEETAVNGRWVDGPGADLFLHLRAGLGDLPMIAEDLGEITPDVHQLRDDFALPGMKVLQFAFDGPNNPFLPHNYVGNNWVVYTGTHDNDTTRGWFHSCSDHERWFMRRYLNKDVHSDPAWDLIRLAWASPAKDAIVPLQDVLDLGTEARMNFPGKPNSNWHWRVLPGAFGDHHIHRLAELTELYNR